MAAKATRSARAAKTAEKVATEEKKTPTGPYVFKLEPEESGHFGAIQNRRILAEKELELVNTQQQLWAAGVLGRLKQPMDSHISLMQDNNIQVNHVPKAN